MMAEKHSRRTLLTVLLVALVVLLAFKLEVPGRVAYAIEKGRLEATSEELASVEQLSSVFRMVASNVKPAVVKIISEPKVEPDEKDGALRRLPGGRRDIEELPWQDLPEPWRRFFGDLPFRSRPEGSSPLPRRRRAPQSLGMGSGVIVDAAKGYILTNYHVIMGAGKLRVALADGRTVQPRNVEVVGKDKLTDLAVIRIKKDRLHDLAFGDSDQVSVGDYVLAVGNPFGLEGSVSAGIISAKGRTRIHLTGYEDFIQTDAAINPGNSGGPLVNIQGRIIGLNTAIPTKTGTYNGFGFAIPGNLAKRVMTRLIEEGKVIRGHLGVSIEELGPGEGSRIYGLENDLGVRVTGVKRDGPADKGGMMEGDLLLAMDGQTLRDTGDLQNRVAFTRPGTSVKFEILREGKRQILDVKVGEQPEDFSPYARGPMRDFVHPRQRSETPDEVASSDRLGLTVTTLTPRLAKRFGWSEDEEGAVVTEVEPGSEAESRGLVEGNLIVATMRAGQRRTISSAVDFSEQVTDETLRGGLQLVVRNTDGFTRYLFIPPD